VASNNNITFRPSLDIVRAAIRRRIAGIMNLTVPNAQAGVMLDAWVQRNFNAEGGLVGGWTPFVRGGRRLRGGGFDASAKLLQDTGALRASFRPFWSARQVGIGSDIPYSRYHEFGTTRAPARRMLPSEREIMPQLMRIYDRWTRLQTARRLW